MKIFHLLLGTLTAVECYDFIIRSVQTTGNFSPQCHSNFTSQCKLKNGDGQWIGDLFQDIILDPNLQRVGTHRGYRFKTSLEHDDGAHRMEHVNSNRIWFLEGGDELNLHNEAIVSVTGKYAKFLGGHLEEKELQLVVSLHSEGNSINPYTRRELPSFNLLP